MVYSSALLTTILAVAVSALDINATSLNSDYTCVGTFIFGRHNDRTAKPATILTTLGATNQIRAGNYYRQRYFGYDGDDTEVSSDFKITGMNDQGYYVFGEMYAQAPASNVIEYSQMSFIQGLYPPSTVVNSNDTLEDTAKAGLSNGSSVIGPFDGYQYVFMDVQGETSEDYFWIKGDVNCPNSDIAMKAWKKSDEFNSLNSSTYDFYQSLSALLPSKSFPSWSLNFGNAYSIFDYMNVNYVHDEEEGNQWNSTLMFQVRTLADAYQWGLASATPDDARIGGETMLGAVYEYLNTTKVAGSPYINYFTGSYNTMTQMFKLLQLDGVSTNFTGLPDYGATFVWDLLLDSSNNYYVLFSFMNGTQPDNGTPLTNYPILGASDALMTWSDFETAINKVSINSLEVWCSMCNSTADIAPQCAKYSDAYEYGTTLESKGANITAIASGDYSSLNIKEKSSKLSLADAGGIGAGVTIGVFLILGALGYLFYKSKKKSSNSVLPVAAKAEDHKLEDLSTSSDSDHEHHPHA